MTVPDLPARRLIAGAVGPERRPYRKDRDEPRWFEPLHVRAAGLSREALARSVAVGANLLVAPTWLTHRRALLPTGETRRAAAWTAAAVRIAREAVDRGLELRVREAEAQEAALERGEAPASAGHGGVRGVGGVGGAGVAGVGLPRLPVLVAGVLPFLGGWEEAESGRLTPRDAGVERDLRAAAGLITEAGADLVLVEGGPSVTGARAAADAAIATGLPVWVIAPVRGTPVPALAGGEAIETWAASMVHAGVATLLLEPGPGTDVEASLERLRGAGVAAERTGVLPMAIGPSAFGAASAAATDATRDPGEASDPREANAFPWLPDQGATADAVPSRETERAERTPLEAAAIRWLEAGAWHAGLGDGATPERLAAVRAAIDAVDGARLAARAAARDRWVALVGEAARRAPGGRAAWIGPRDRDEPLPTGFAWSVVPAELAAALPTEELRLVIAATPLAAKRLAALLAPGGILLARDLDADELAPTGLRLLDVVDRPAAVLARRDP